MAGLIFFWNGGCVRYDSVIPPIIGADYEDQVPVTTAVFTDRFGAARVVVDNQPISPVTLMDRFGSAGSYTDRLPPPVCTHD